MESPKTTEFFEALQYAEVFSFMGSSLFSPWLFNLDQLGPGTGVGLN